MATHASLANPIFISMDWEQPAPEYGAVRGMNIAACWLLSNGISRGKKIAHTSIVEQNQRNWFGR